MELERFSTDLHLKLGPGGQFSRNRRFHMFGNQTWRRFISFGTTTCHTDHFLCLKIEHSESCWIEHTDVSLHSKMIIQTIYNAYNRTYRRLRTLKPNTLKMSCVIFVASSWQGIIVHRSMEKFYVSRINNSINDFQKKTMVYLIFFTRVISSNGLILQRMFGGGGLKLTLLLIIF